MTQSRVLMFLISVFAMIALISLTVPEDGLTVAGRTLQFPTAGEMAEKLSTSRAPYVLSPEEVLAERHEALAAAQKDRYEDYINSDPARIWFPDSDVTLFDGFFRALGDADSQTVRVMHYGDSQLEEDRITGTLRDLLQNRFGGLGPGLLPLDKYYTPAISEVASYYPDKSSVFGYVGDSRNDGLYGPLGVMTSLDSAISVTVVPAKDCDKLMSRSSRLTVLLGRSRGEVTVRCGSQSRNFSADNSIRSIRSATFELPDSSKRVRFSVSGGADSYGVMLDGRTGVSVDNIAMRGCSGDVFTRIESSLISDYADLAGVRLVILQFGGNAVPYSSRESAIAYYCETMKKQIRHIRQTVPDAAILFIGPSDMSTNVKGSMVTYPHLPRFVEALRTAVNEAGAAYWDMFAVMGGEGSMARWAKAKPALAGSDHIHFTRAGSEKMGELLYETLIFYYDYYGFRNRK